MTNVKSGWRMVKLGEVAVNSTVATKNHVAENFSRYIIGKHIPENGGNITSWNPVGDAEFGSRIRTIVRTGDVLCTTRGPKLKVAVANFDCLSSHTNFILRPKNPELLLPVILEAVVRSAGFQDHLRKHFRGSTNLFVNWSDAAEYQFALPPIAEQCKLAQSLVAARCLVEAANKASEAASVSRRSWQRHIVSLLLSGPVAPLGDFLEGSPDNGCSAPERDEETGHWVLSLTALGQDGYIQGHYKSVDPTPAMLAATLFDGDLLISRSNTRERVGYIGRFLALGKCVSFPDTMMRLRPNTQKTSSDWLELLIQSTPIRGAIQASAAGTSASMKKINRKNLVSISLPDIPIRTQDQYLAIWRDIRRAEMSAKNRSTLASQLYSTLLHYGMTP